METIMYGGHEVELISLVSSGAPTIRLPRLRDGEPGALAGDQAIVNSEVLGEDSGAAVLAEWDGRRWIAATKIKGLI